MKQYSNIHMENIDTFCSVFGNELVFENNGYSNFLLPCLNLGFYENSINPEIITKGVERCYLLFKKITKIYMEFNLYHSLFPDKKNEINLSKDILKYTIDISSKTMTIENEYTFEGLCFRNNSFSYATFKIHSDSLNVIIPDNHLGLVDYNTIGNNFKTNKKIIDFLLNRNDNVPTSACL